jgi:hypothetical protein
VTLVEILELRGIPYRRHSTRGDEICLCCPFCSSRGETPDHRFRLGINTAQGMGHCFNCGWRSQNAVQRLLDYLGMKDQCYQAPQNGAGSNGSCSVSLPAGFSIVGTVGDELDRLALQYLLKRGVSRRQIVRCKVGATFVGNYAYRVVFPLWYNGKLQGFVARDIAGHEPRYLSGGRKALFNPKPAETLILAEGIFKALRIERALNHPVSATLGRELTDYQLQQLQALGVGHVALWPDPDKAGRQGCIRSAELLRANGFNVSIVWPIRKPADEASLGEIRQSYHASPYNWQTQAKLMLGGD